MPTRSASRTTSSNVEPTATMRLSSSDSAIHRSNGAVSKIAARRSARSISSIYKQILLEGSGLTRREIWTGGQGETTTRRGQPYHTLQLIPPQGSLKTEAALRHAEASPEHAKPQPVAVFKILPTTLTTFGLHRFPSAWAKPRFRPSQSWVVPQLNVGTLPHELAPGQQWVGAIEQREDTAAEINKSDLYVGIYDAFHRRPTLAKIIPPSQPRARGPQ